VQGRQGIEGTGRLSSRCPSAVELVLLLSSFNSWYEGDRLKNNRATFLSTNKLSLGKNARNTVKVGVQHEDSNRRRRRWPTRPTYLCVFWAASARSAASWVVVAVAGKHRRWQRERYAVARKGRSTANARAIPRTGGQAAPSGSGKK